MEKTSNLIKNSQGNSNEIIIDYGSVDKVYYNDVTEEKAVFFIYTSHDAKYTPFPKGEKVAPSKKWFGLKKDNSKPKELLMVKGNVKFNLYLDFYGSLSSFTLIFTVIPCDPLKVVKARKMNVRKLFVDRIQEIETLALRIIGDGTELPYDILKMELNKIVKELGLFIAHLLVIKNHDNTLHPTKKTPYKNRHIA